MNTEKQNTHYAKLRRNFRNKIKKTSIDSNIVGKYPYPNAVYLYGIHTVISALKNPKRHIYLLLITNNCLKKIQEHNITNLPKYEIVDSKSISSLFEQDTVHQGIVAIAKPLESKPISKLADSKLIVMLDQITDPHNVGAIMRSCVALGVEALITTNRHSPKETGTLAKSASGAVDLINYINVRNLADTINELNNLGFTTIGLDSAGDANLSEMYKQNSYDKIALILGAEGKGLRDKTRKTVTTLARLDMPGAIKSLNVSNAASIAIYLTYCKLREYK